MKESNPNITSLVPNKSNSLVSTKNAIDLTNKLIHEQVEKQQKQIKEFYIKLDSGKEVKVNSFSFNNTYGGLIFGRIDDDEYNKELFERTTYPRNWGECKTLKIKPSDEEFQKGLKPFCFTVWLNSYKPIDPWYDGSELIVIWFADIPSGASIEEIILNGVKSVDWETNAQDYEL